MSRCFKSGKNLSAKEYTHKKRNYNLFCDIRNKFISNSYKSIGSDIACVSNDGIFINFKNKSTQLNITKGFEEFSSKYRTDYSNNYIGQKFKNHFCSPIDNITNNNYDVSNNYTSQGPLNTVSSSLNNTSQDNQMDSSGQYVNRYAEIRNVENIVKDSENKFINEKKIIYEVCPVRRGNKIFVVKANDLPPPIISSLEIIIF
tara:strand:- start:3310 stop:3915 length:606 start_codon:yes stop_codon:yes gene_type:complete